MEPQKTDNTVLDDVQKKLNDSYAAWQNAIGQANQNAQERVARPDEPGTTYEDFLKGSIPAQPATQVDPKKEKARAWITNIADAINAVGGIVGAARGADVTPMASLSAANQQRYNKLLEQRAAEEELYNKGVMQAQSHAMSMAEAYRRKRQQEDAQAAALDQARVNQAKMDYDKAADDYNRIYRQSNDAETRAARDRQENRLWTQHQDDVNYRNASGARADRAAVESHNKEEEKKWTRLPGGRYIRNEDYPMFVDKVYSALAADKDIKMEILQNYGTQLRLAEVKGGSEEHNIKQKIINSYLNSSDENKARIAYEAAAKSGLYGTPDFWVYEEGESGNSRIRNNAQVKTADVSTPTEQTNPAPSPNQSSPAYATQYGFNGTYGSRIDTTKVNNKNEDFTL